MHQLLPKGRSPYKLQDWWSGRGRGLQPKELRRGNVGGKVRSSYPETITVNTHTAVLSKALGIVVFVTTLWKERTQKYNLELLICFAYVLALLALLTTTNDTSCLGWSWICQYCFNAFLGRHVHRGPVELWVNFLTAWSYRKKRAHAQKSSLELVVCCSADLVHFSHDGTHPQCTLWGSFYYTEEQTNMPSVLILLYAPIVTMQSERAYWQGPLWGSSSISSRTNDNVE